MVIKKGGDFFIGVLKGDLVFVEFFLFIDRLLEIERLWVVEIWALMFCGIFF